MSKQYVVRILPWTVGNRELKQYFSQFGEVIKALVVFDKNTGLSRGIGFVDLKSGDSIQPLESVKEHIIDGKKIEVLEKRL